MFLWELTHTQNKLFLKVKHSSERTCGQDCYKKRLATILWQILLSGTETTKSLVGL